VTAAVVVVVTVVVRMNRLLTLRRGSAEKVELSGTQPKTLACSRLEDESGDADRRRIEPPNVDPVDSRIHMAEQSGG
jgi:hypothetical protein